MQRHSGSPRQGQARRILWVMALRVIEAMMSGGPAYSWVSGLSGDSIKGHILERNESCASLVGKVVSGMSASDAFPGYWDSKFALSQLRPAPRAGLRGAV